MNHVIHTTIVNFIWGIAAAVFREVYQRGKYRDAIFADDGYPNGSSLFTDDVGQGENNIRRWIIENEWLQAIIALPENF